MSRLKMSKFKLGLIVFLSVLFIWIFSDYTGDKSKERGPELRILTVSQGFKMEDEVPYAVSEGLTGHKVKYYTVSSDKAELKLFLEIAGGADYDMLYRIDAKTYRQLAAKNALMDIKPLLDKYGLYIYDGVSDWAWDTVKDGEKITGIPHEILSPPAGSPSITGGIGVKSHVLQKLGLELPETIDEFTEFLRLAKKDLGLPPLVTCKNGLLAPDIMSAFGMGEPFYYDIDGVYTPIVKHKGLPEYLKYMQMLYREGLIDNDAPINTIETAFEKFVTPGFAAITPFKLWNIPAALKAIDDADCKVLFITSLTRNKGDKRLVYLSQGVDYVTCIPKTGRNPVLAVKWFNAVSRPDNFKKIYLGDEGISYEFKNGGYYPLFPAFNDYINADKFVGAGDKDIMYKYWLARAKKTKEMELAFLALNENINSAHIVESAEGYSINIPGGDSKTALINAFSDSFTKAVIKGGDPHKAVDAMIKQWDEKGGLTLDKEMQSWYGRFKSLFSIFEW